MNNPLRQKAWSPYVVGIGIGLLSWFTFATVDKPLGITTSFENTAALIGKAPAPHAAQRQAYYQDPSHKAKIDWQWALVVGVFVGAWVSSKLSGDREKVKVPALWRSRFGPSVTKRMTGAFVGGLGLAFPADATWLEMRDVLTRHLDYDRDQVAPEWLRDIALGYGVDDVTRFSGIRQLYDRIFLLLSQRGDGAIAEWFVWNVAREAAPRIGARDTNTIRDVANEVAADPRVIASIKRYRGEDLMDFGTATDADGWTGTGGSLRSIAYQTVADKLRERISGGGA